MAATYGAWEYYTGPLLYIDKHGFKYINENNHFVYWYEVEYGPVEYRRKVTNEQGISVYESKFSFGINNSSRKSLGIFNFEGDTQLTKVVKHEIVEDGFKQSINKTFYINTNNIEMGFDNSNINMLPGEFKLATKDWKMGGQKSTVLGWKNGMNSSFSIDINQLHSINDVDYIILYIKNGEIPLHIAPLIYAKVSSFIQEFEPLKREIVNPFEIIGYKVPISLIEKALANGSDIKCYIEPGENLSSSGISCYVLGCNYHHNDKDLSNVELLSVFVAVGTSGVINPYVNLVFQSYNSNLNSWTDCLTVPYLNRNEILRLRSGEYKSSKNIFLPQNLPESDGGYRIRIDTNLTGDTKEIIDSFKIDVLSEQKVPTGLSDKAIYISNDTLNKEYFIDNVDEIKLNALNFIDYTKETEVGFLKEGANDISGYLKSTNVEIQTPEKDIENKTENIFCSKYLGYKHGHWISNKIFASHSIDIPKVGILKTKDTRTKILEFFIPYKDLAPNANYYLEFEIEVFMVYDIPDIYTINEVDKDNIIESLIFSNCTGDQNKITVKNIDEIIFKPHHNIKYSNNSMSFVDGINKYNKTILKTIEIKTDNLSSFDTDEFKLSIWTEGIANIYIKNMRWKRKYNNNKVDVDVFNTYGDNDTNERYYETNMILYYNKNKIEYINPLVYDDLMYLKNELDKIRSDYSMIAYKWDSWLDKDTGVQKNSILKAAHFDEIKNCCYDTYEKLLDIGIDKETDPSEFKMIPYWMDSSGQKILQHVYDVNKKSMDFDDYFPEWKLLIDLLNKN